MTKHKAFLMFLKKKNNPRHFLLFYFFVLVTFQIFPLTRPQICDMESFCDVRQQGGRAAS